jgi:hypothetical protein
MELVALPQLAKARYLGTAAASMVIAAALLATAVPDANLVLEHAAFHRKS